MTGVSEILLLILLISGILIIPRMFKPAPRTIEAPKRVAGLSKKMRIGIVLSILVPFLFALVLKPWEGHLTSFILLGLVPVGIAWAVFWIMSAPKK